MAGRRLSFELAPEPGTVPPVERIRVRDLVDERPRDVLQARDRSRHQVELVLHAFEGKSPFSTETREVIEQLKTVYGCELTASDSHQLVED